jgi:hypothetical protein
VTRQRRRYAVQKEGTALKTLALFVKENPIPAKTFLWNSLVSKSAFLCRISLE